MVEVDVESLSTACSGCDEFDRMHRRRLLDFAEEVHGEMERFGARPPYIGNAFAKVVEQPLHRTERRLSKRNSEKAPQALLVGEGTGDGVGAGVSQGLPPALVSVTEIWLALQS